MNHQSKPILIITGANGLIGTKLQQRFVKEYTVIGLDIAEPKHKLPGTVFIKCDLTNDKDVFRALSEIERDYGQNIASVFHLAAYYDFSGAESPLYQELTVKGSERLIKHLQDFNVEQFVFSSTNLVMKPLHRVGQTIREEDALEGSWAYPKSKIEAESVLKQHRGKIPLVILRIAGVYDEEGHSPPISNQISRIYEKKLESLFYPGNKEFGQAFIHLEDVIDFFALVLGNRKNLAGEENFFVSEPEIVSYAQLQTSLGLLIHNRKWPTLPIPKSVAKLGAFFTDLIHGGQSFIKPWMVDLTNDHYPLSMEKAKDKLGFVPTHRLLDTLPSMIKNLKANPKKFYLANKLQLPRQELRRLSYEEKIDLQAAPTPWRHNPSSWAQRISISLLASVAVIIATYMSFYQLGFISEVWDPIFGDQTKRVLDSDVSHEMRRWFRMPDALLGALAYLGDILFALAGSTRRWQFRPWLVIIFGIDVIPLGIVSIILVLTQAFVVNNWCFLCLVTAGISLILIVLAFDEVWSCLIFLSRVWKKSGNPKILWKTFWGIATLEAHEVGESMTRRR